MRQSPEQSIRDLSLDTVNTPHPRDGLAHVRPCQHNLNIVGMPSDREHSLLTYSWYRSVARSCATALVLPEPRYVSMEQVAELFLLTRGVRSVVEACREWLDATPMAPMLKGYETPRDDQVPLHASIDEQFTNLERMTETACSDEQQTRICKEAISCLRDVYRSVAHYDAKDTLQTGALDSPLTMEIDANGSQVTFSPGSRACPWNLWSLYRLLYHLLW